MSDEEWVILFAAIRIADSKLPRDIVEYKNLVMSKAKEFDYLSELQMFVQLVCGD